MAKVLGIDLGTTNTCVAAMDGGTPRVLANRAGYTTTPSVIAVTEDGRRLVGQLAERQAVTNPTNTVYATKRLLGRAWDSDEAAHIRKTAAYELCEGPSGEVQVKLAGEVLSIPELSSYVLQEARVIGEAFFGETVDKAVVTVPAYFNDRQRLAVQQAGKIAGLDVLRVLNEPTAAAIAYGFSAENEQVIAVYDLGGGTFDISIVAAKGGGRFEVLGTTGDDFLGGEDFDERIVDWLSRAFSAEHGVDIYESPTALQRLRQAARAAKVELSSVAFTEIKLPFLMEEGPDGPVHMQYEVGREDLERLTEDLVERTMESCERALSFAGLDPSSVHEVVLVGGMTRMPAVQGAVSEYFGRAPCKGVHPDEVVALGAAVLAESLASDDAGDLDLTDVTAHALGIMTAGNHFDVIVPTNTRVPCDVPATFTTSRDAQSSVHIVILQGESEKASENDPLSQLALRDLRSAAAGEVQVEVTFKIDDDGLLSVNARDTETGRETTIDVTTGGGLSDEELTRMAEASEAWLEGRRSEDAHERIRQGANNLASEIERLTTLALEKFPGDSENELLLKEAYSVTAEAYILLDADDRNLLSDHVVALENVKERLLQVMRFSDVTRLR